MALLEFIVHMYKYKYKYKFAYKFDKFACYMWKAWRGARARVPSQACCQQFL